MMCICKKNQNQEKNNTVFGGNVYLYLNVYMQVHNTCINIVPNGLLAGKLIWGLSQPVQDSNMQIMAFSLIGIFFFSKSGVWKSHFSKVDMLVCKVYLLIDKVLVTIKPI